MAEKEKVEEKKEVLFTVTKDNIWKILTVVLAVALVFVLFKGNSDAPQALEAGAGNPEAAAPQQPAVVDVSADDDPVKGDKKAPVTIIEFSDYQCPYCARFYTDTLPKLEETYIKTGKAKLIMRDFPLSFHQFAQKASEAAECADDQGKYWEYHNKLFDNQQALDIASLKKYAKDLSLDTAKFDSCLDTGKYTAEVQKDFQDGQKAGVSGTPSFFVNGNRIVGAQPFPAFEQIIEAELKK